VPYFLRPFEPPYHWRLSHVSVRRTDITRQTDPGLGIAIHHITPHRFCPGIPILGTHSPSRISAPAGSHLRHSPFLDLDIYRTIGVRAQASAPLDHPPAMPYD